MTKREWYEQVVQCAFIMYGALSVSDDDKARRVLDLISETLFAVPDDDAPPSEGGQS